MLINVKMIVGILKFMSIVNFVLSLVDYEKSFITSGPAISNIGFEKQFNSTFHLRSAVQSAQLVIEGSLV